MLSMEQLDLSGKNVFLRLDLNVPLRDGKITDETRIMAALPTLKYALEHANRVVVASHLGRPKGQVNSSMSLEPVGHKLAELLGKEVVFVSDYEQEPVDSLLKTLGKDRFVLLENLRFHKGETANDAQFVDVLAKGVNCYVNDAFGAAHRSHASITGLAERFSSDDKAPGFLMVKELESLGRLLKQQKAPFTTIIGGAKVSDKIGVMLSLIERCNHLVIGGAMAYTFLAFKGVDVGKSMVEKDRMDLVESIFREAELRKVQIHLPIDHICSREFKADGSAETIREANIPEDMMGLDIGPMTLEKYKSVIRNSETVLWNGPMGVFEWDAFSKGTMGIAEEVAACRGWTVVGGGDSVAAVNKAGVADRIDHVSTGGGASLELLEGKTLPGVKVLQS